MPRIPQRGGEFPRVGSGASGRICVQRVRAVEIGEFGVAGKSGEEKCVVAKVWGVGLQAGSTGGRLTANGGRWPAGGYSAT